MRKTTWGMRGVLAAVAVAVAPAMAAAQPAARDTGLILGSVEAAATRPVERIADFSLLVDLSERTLYVMSGDDVVRRFPVAVGAQGYATPSGSFRIQRMIWNPSWTPPASAWARNETAKGPGEPGNPMGRVKIFFREPDYYIHGTNLTSSLGNARSHGCIRLRNIDAVELAKMVMVHGGSDRGEDWYRQTIASATTSRTVTLGRPVTVRVRA